MTCRMYLQTLLEGEVGALLLSVLLGSTFAEGKFAFGLVPNPICDDQLLMVACLDDVAMCIPSPDVVWV